MTRDTESFPFGQAVVVALAIAIMIGLGVWQLQRLAWKTDILARIDAARTAPARPVADALADGSNGAFAHVVAVCPGLSTAPFVELYAIRSGNAGSRLVSLCPIEAGPFDAILIDRGFVADTVSARPPVVIGDLRPIGVRGLLRRGEGGNLFSPPNDPAHKRFYTRDIPALASALGSRRPAPYVLMAETSSNPDWPVLLAEAAPAEISNNHLAYALTWFGLAAALIGVFGARIRSWAQNRKG